ncbi:hypothetical protein BC938DRAFT_480216 [Jimgerdemannia flammicorona]|uniref:Transmembrane protein n=1 Tax=Jimgerdemannia flammicorona TaxID=994334 RepID=A0A433QJ02_9FUNG|nr:hypothetical protein BC938DRAFT_480216 [Jimgerdemannia flammicorona]
MDLDLLKNIVYIFASLSALATLALAAKYSFTDGYIDLDVGTVSLLIGIIEKVIMSGLTLSGVEFIVSIEWQKVTTRGGFIKLSEAVRSLQRGVIGVLPALLGSSGAITFVLMGYTVFALVVIASGIGLAKGLGTMEIAGNCSELTQQTYATPNCSHEVFYCGVIETAMNGRYPSGVARTNNIVRTGFDNNITVLGHPGFAVAAHVGSDILTSDVVTVTNLPAVVANASCIANVSAAVSGLINLPWVNITTPNGASYLVWDQQGFTMLETSVDIGFMRFALVVSDPNNVTLPWYTNMNTMKGNGAALFECNFSVGLAVVNITQNNSVFDSTVTGFDWVKFLYKTDLNDQTSSGLNTQADGFNFNALTYANNNKTPTSDPFRYDSGSVAGIEMDLAKYVATAAIVSIDMGLSRNSSTLSNATFMVTQCKLKSVTTIRYWPLMLVWMIVSILSALSMAILSKAQRSGRKFANSQSELATKNTLVWQSLTTSWGLARILYDAGDWCADSKEVFIGKMNAIKERVGIVRRDSEKYGHFGLVHVDEEEDQSSDLLQ